MSQVRVGELDVNFERLPPVTPPPDGEAPIVVCVHGLLTDSLASYYFTLAPVLVERGLDVLMYDLRGHGRTTRPATGYRLEDFVGDLRSLLDTLGITRPVYLVGNSFGGAIAFGLAAVCPERVAGVALIEAEPPTPGWAQRMADGLAAAKVHLANDEVIGWISEKAGAHTARLSKAAGRILQVTTMAEEIPRSATILPDLSTVDVPVLGIFGDSSGMAALVPQLEASMTWCRTVVLAEQGHSVLVERTAETVELVYGWVREIDLALAEAH